MKKHTMSLATRRKVLIVHLISSSTWIGAVIVLLLLSILAKMSTHPQELLTLHQAIRIIEYGLIIPPAFTSLITGFFLSGWTKWGYFQYWWVTVKWIVTIGLILFGAFFLNTWIEGMVELAKDLELEALFHNTYTQYSWLNIIFVSLQWSLLIFLVVISVLKPWGRRQKKMTRLDVKTKSTRE